jgi:23S rRNA (adenine2503-C2)-methyltransferase
LTRPHVSTLVMNHPQPKRPLLDAKPGELRDWIIARDYPAYRAGQVLRWVAERRGETFAAMNDVPRRLREELDAEWTVFATTVDHHDISPDGTEKLLLACPDGRRIECVLMAEDDRRTVCISTQVGCGMGCVFCASGMKGVVRNLTKGEILEQVVRLRNLLPVEERLTNLVVMGMGESLANLDNLVPALDWICSPEGLGMGQRRVTISTVGLPEKIRKLAELDRQYHLAVSLHAPTEALRDELVPINAKVGLAAVMDAADAYFQRSGRQVTFEYVLLAGVNDRREDALALANLLRARKAHANLIPYNPVEGLPFGRPSPDAVRRFAETVRAGGVSVSVRKTKGRPIDAACGQLRRRLEGVGAGPAKGTLSAVAPVPDAAPAPPIG